MTDAQLLAIALGLFGGAIGWGLVAMCVRALFTGRLVTPREYAAQVQRADEYREALRVRTESQGDAQDAMLTAILQAVQALPARSEASR